MACALSLVATHASAGTYLDRAGLLLLEARAEGDMLRRRPSDKELAEAIVTLSEARLKVAEEIRVPESVAKAHPHLLLVLANANRAARAAVDGDMKKFVELSEATRAEAATYRALLQDAGYTLPDACPK